ncbi:MAG: molybdopterin-binding protein [Rhodobacteraceae bacterium]|nr:molybdopterin-binding protein [Paracoccaceae bacterium]
MVSNTENPSAAFLVIGDEVLSGRTQDMNVAFIAKSLSEKGVDLIEVRIVPDVVPTIASTLNELRNKFDLVFTSGGIGPTHDDMTAEAVAEAFSTRLEINSEAKALIEARAKAQSLELNKARLRMAHIPVGAKLINNSVSGAPGFNIGNVYVMAGVPKIFRAMVSEVIPGLPEGKPQLSRTITINRPEGEIAHELGRIAKKWPSVSIGSYPFFKDNTHGTTYGSNVVVRGHDEESVSKTEEEIKNIFLVWNANSKVVSS